MPRDSVRMRDCETGLPVERTVTVGEASTRGARKMALALYSCDDVAVGVHLER